MPVSRNFAVVLALAVALMGSAWALTSKAAAEPYAGAPTSSPSASISIVCNPDDGVVVATATVRTGGLSARLVDGMFQAWNWEASSHSYEEILVFGTRIYRHTIPHGKGTYFATVYDQNSGEFLARERTGC